MKLVLQVAAGIVLAVCVLAGGIYSYNRYTHRSTANQYEWTAARDYMSTLAKTCPALGSSSQCAELAVNACRGFHINDSDCSDLVHNAVQTVRANNKEGQ